MKKQSKPLKKLAKSQKKLKRAFANLGKSGKNAENPVWVTALAAIAGAVTTALADSHKREQLKGIAVEAKDKALGLLGDTEPKKPAEEARSEDVHLQDEGEELREHV